MTIDHHHQNKPGPSTLRAGLLALTMLACAHQDRPDDSTEPSSPARTDTSTQPGAHAPSSADEGRQRVPGTALSLIPPAGFVLAENFAGFLQPDRGTSIMVTFIPGPFAQVSAGFNDPARLSQQGMTVVQSSELAQGQLQGKLLQVRQRVAEMTVEKWIWVIGDDERSMLVMGTCLEAACAQDLQALESAVRSAVWDPDAVVDPLEGLGFSFADYGGLKLGPRTGSLLNLSDTGTTVVDPRTGVSFVFGPAMGSGPIEDREGFAKQRVAALPFEALAIDTIEPVSVDGLDGLVLLGEARSSGAEVFVYCVFLFEPSNYWIGVGSAPATQRAAAHERFTAITGSFARSSESTTDTGRR